MAMLQCFHPVVFILYANRQQSSRNGSLMKVSGYGNGESLVTPEDCLWAMLAYVGIACGMVLTLFIVLFKRNESGYIAFHSLQATVLGLLLLLVLVLESCIVPWLSNSISISSMGMILFQLAVLLVCLGTWFTFIIQAFRGKTTQLPWIGSCLLGWTLENFEKE
jgi:uncharacterized membrane protein